MTDTAPILAPGPCYIIYRHEPVRERPGTISKLPLAPSGHVADAFDRAHQMTYPDAVQTVATLGGYRLGVGCVVQPSYVFIDLDHCLTPTGCSDAAREIVAMLPGAFIETSISGSGLHIICRSSAPPPTRQVTGFGGLYTSGRWVALTGTNARGDMNADCTEAVAAVAAKWFPATAPGAVPAEWTDGPCDGYGGLADDDELIRLACRSQSAAATFGTRASFAQLWTADADALGRAYPDNGPQGRAYDESAADAALAAHLAFWTGRDCERMRRLMERSALRREKWNREDYMRRTILGAMARCRTVATGRREVAARDEEAQTIPKTLTHTSRDPLPVSSGLQSNGLIPFGGPRLVLRRAADVQSEPINWLWRGYLARGKLHVLAGAAGSGKTTLALAMAATITRGAEWPDHSRASSGSVLIWSGEDGIADSLKPRLEANGADTSAVYFVHAVEHADQRRSFDPATDMALLESAAREAGNVALLIVDPIVSAVAADSHKNAEVRRGLQPLVDLAESIGCAVLGISHFTKGTQGRDPTERVTGSLAFAALARVVLCTAKPTEPGMSRRLVRSKSNIGPDGGGFEYELAQTCVRQGPPDVFGQRVAWGAEITGAAVALLGEVETPTELPRDAPALEAAVTFLRNELAEGPMSVATLREDAKGAGVSWPTIKRAKIKLGVCTVKASMEGGWEWSLPTEGDQGDAI